MELAGEKVLMAPTLQETFIDTSRKTLSPSRNDLPNLEGVTSASNRRIAVRDGHDHGEAIEHLGARVGPDKEAHRRQHKHRHRRRRSSHEEEARHNSHKHGQEVARLKTTKSEAALPIVHSSVDRFPYFIEDRRGDEYNATYGSVHRYSIPRYRTAGHQRVLGLGRTHKILQSSEGETRMLSEAHIDSDVRLKASSLLVGNVNRQKAPTRILPKHTDVQARVAELQRDFLSLSAHGSRKRRRLEAEEAFHVVPHDRSPASGSRSAEQEARPRRQAVSEPGEDEPGSGTSSDASEDDSFERLRNEARQQKTVELSRAVDDRPQDVEAWLALIRHQDSVLEPKEGTKRVLTNAERYGLADVKISIYTTALSKNRNNPDRDRLVIGMMEEGSKIWDYNKLAKQWRAVLKENAHCPNLWIKYLDFEQTNFLTFTYDQCKSGYAECLRTISLHSLDRNRDHLCIYTLLRMTAFMKDAGYSEHAVGIWQAVLEYNYFHPDGLEDQTERVSFADFWNSEVARVGEEGARGWRSGSSVEVAPSSDTSNVVIDPTVLFYSWPQCEQERMLNASLPARTLDEVKDDDPYRVILFSDVSKYLFRVTELENKVLLLNAFLLFCGQPPLPSTGWGSGQRWWTDSFIRSSQLCQINIASASTSRQTSPTAFPVTSFVTDTSNMFAEPDYWFSCWQDMEYSSSDPYLSQFHLLALRQLVDVTPTNDQLAEYIIAYQLNRDAREARKFAKALLKQRPSDLRLYNAYALVECRLSNVQTAERVWSTALSMSRTFPDNERQNAVLLWRSWLWQLLDHGEPRKAFALLLAVAEGQVELDNLSQQSSSIRMDAHSTATLKARRDFESNVAQATSLRQSDLIVHYSDLLALLAYFTSIDQITAALAVYSTILDPSQPTNAITTTIEDSALQLLHQSRARLLHHHTRTSSSFRPTQIMHALSASLALFPNNTIFQSLYHTHTRHALLTDRIRTVIPTPNSTSHSSSTTNPSFIPSIFAIYSATSRPIYTGRTHHSIRASFERALATNEPSHHSPALWTWYLRWELSITAKSDSSSSSSSSSDPQTKDTSTLSLLSLSSTSHLSTAQDIFYRAMRACPWAKSIYMLAFTESRLRDSIGFEGLRRIYETMVEKGLRIHVDLGDVLEEGKG